MKFSFDEPAEALREDVIDSQLLRMVRKRGIDFLIWRQNVLTEGHGDSLLLRTILRVVDSMITPTHSNGCVSLRHTTWLKRY